MDAFERKILRQTYSPIKDDKGWMIRYNNENYDLYKDIKVAKRLQWSRGSRLAFSTQVYRFKPGRSRRIFRAKKSSTCLPLEGK